MVYAVRQPPRPPKPIVIRTTVRMRVRVEMVPWERDENGVLQERPEKAYIQPGAHSWVTAAASFLMAQFDNVNQGSVVDTAGVSQTLTTNTSGSPWMRADGGANANTFGIQVGTSATAPVETDTALGALIAHGTSSGQLSHAAMVITPAAAITNGYRVVLSRVLTNLSGAAITINEIGLACRNGSNRQFLTLHDAISGGYVLSDGSAVTFRYLIDWLMSGTTQPWTQAMAQQLASALDLVNTAVTDTGGASRTVNIGNASAQALSLDAAIATATYGIVVGTGTTAPVETDTALTTQIAEGSGAGQLTHQVCAVSGPTAITGGYKITITRQFDNNSGGDITVQEAALYCLTVDTGSTNRFFAITHQLTGAVTISNGGSRTFTWVINFLV